VFGGRRIDGRTPQQINRLGLARSFQITNVFPRLTVFENIRLAVMRRHGLQYTFWRPIERLAPLREEAERLLERVRLQPHAHALAAEMSYSAQRALELAMTLACDPQAILLDEPMAGMSAEETQHALALIREAAQGRALLLVEHDMDVVFSLADRISVLVYGQVIATGTPDEIRRHPGVREAYLGEEAAA
jgi:branched-chain amino acid transport system ATP-binding protein